MKPFKFFQKEDESFTARWEDGMRAYEEQRLTHVEQMERERTINDALRHEEYLHSIYLRDNSVVDYGQMAREIREQARLRSIVTMSIERPNELLHRGRRPRNL